MSPTTQDDRTLDDILQLANVSRPRISLAELQCPLVDPVDPLGHLLGETLDEVLDQNRNVLAPFSERRHLNRKDIQSVEQIRSERPVGDRV